jgi:membrane protease YdiL (CAAX protease family)
MAVESPEASPPDANLGPSSSALQASTARARPTAAERVVALLEVILCSDYPTQLALAATFAALGWRAQGPDGTLSAGYVFALSLADTVFLLGLIVVFLWTHGERPREIFLGARPIGAELRAGLPLTLGAFAIAAVVLMAVQLLAPRLHTVAHNPLQDLVRTPGHAAMFAVLAVVAGGVREELQRAFLIHRFEGWLGGRTVGVVVASTAFGAGHLVQGVDAALAIGLLGAFWAVVYLRRRSVVAPMVSHSSFNLLQLAQLLVLGTFG